VTLKRIVFGLFKLFGLGVSLMLVAGLSTFITLQLSTSGDEVIVPDLTGKDAVEAIRILGREGLQLKIFPQKRFDDQIAADRIVVQEPPPKTTIKRGRSIGVYLSLGPQKIIVPDLVGQTSRVANMTLEQNNLFSGRIIYVSYPRAEPDEVVAQYPLAGTEVTTARSVDLLTNSGSAGPSETFVMPDLIGRPVMDAEAFFRACGWRVASSQAVYYPGIQPGVIVKQSPLSGYKVSRDTFIALYYSK
jgi:beta-lactam-binding protein with PASTA domain